MSSDQRWSMIDTLKGWNVCRNFERAVEKAHLKRHPKHCWYIPVSETKQLTEAEVEAYDQLNEKLHDELRHVSHEHFANFPVPKHIQAERGDESFFTPFTYQNYDWYVPTYECYICVLTDYISADLLHRFQSLLHDEYKDWCIRVVGSDGLDFDTDHDIAVFSDEVFVPTAAARAMQVPEEHR